MYCGRVLQACIIENFKEPEKCPYIRCLWISWNPVLYLGFVGNLHQSQKDLVFPTLHVYSLFWMPLMYIKPIWGDRNINRSYWKCHKVWLAISLKTDFQPSGFVVTISCWNSVTSACLVLPSIRCLYSHQWEGTQYRIYTCQWAASMFHEYGNKKLYGWYFDFNSISPALNCRLTSEETMYKENVV